MKSSREKSRLATFSPPVRILIGMIAGTVVGLMFGADVSGLGEMGKIVIGLIKMLATPLILFVVLDSMLRSTLNPKDGLRIVVISIINGVCALAIALRGSLQIE